MTVAVAINWTAVLLAVIPSVPACIAAWRSGLVRKEIRTPSGTTIGKQVEHANVTAIANNQLLGAVHGHTKPGNGAELKAAVEAQAPQVPGDGPDRRAGFDRRGGGS